MNFLFYYNLSISVKTMDQHIQLEASLISINLSQTLIFGDKNCIRSGGNKISLVKFEIAPNN